MRCVTPYPEPIYGSAPRAGFAPRASTSSPDINDAYVTAGSYASKPKTFNGNTAFKTLWLRPCVEFPTGRSFPGYSLDGNGIEGADPYGIDSVDLPEGSDFFVMFIGSAINFLQYTVYFRYLL